MPARDVHDWTDGPAKRLAVFLLGAAVIAALGRTLWSGARPWPAARAPSAPAPALASSETLPEPSAVPPAPRPVAANADKPAKVAVRININTAAKAELDLLPGVGPALADRIIDERTRSGPFKTVEDLSRVRGIGPKTIERLRPHVITE